LAKLKLPEIRNSMSASLLEICSVSRKTATCCLAYISNPQRHWPTSLVIAQS